jgi:hypothetical protein
MAVAGASKASSAKTASATPNGFTPLGVPVNHATNLFVDTDGIPYRYTSPDRGEAIPYLIDADYLPAGITVNQAITAVQTALAAWSAVTSLKYAFYGVQSFGMAASDIDSADGVLRVQLHDRYGSINTNNSNGDILGIGGSYWLTNEVNGWTTGGNVNGSDFHEAVNGFIEIAYTNTVLTNLSLFTEVICHEIGHTIGLAHSSNNPNETNTYLRNAIMYFNAHNDGRGATLGAYDGVVARQVNPMTNTPPYVYDRVMHIVVGAAALSVSNANNIQVRGYDLQTTNLTLATNGETAYNASFAFNTTSNKLSYALPAGTLAGGDVTYDPADGDYLDYVFVRCSDGTNASPYGFVGVVSAQQDSYSEGIPNAWRSAYFGNANPSAGTKHHVTDDADGDGYNNITEFLIGSDPTVKTSNLRITSFASGTVQWQAKPYEIYEIYGSTNLVNWSRVGNPVTPTTTNGAASVSITSPKEFYRVEKVP